MKTTVRAAAFLPIVALPCLPSSGVAQTDTLDFGPLESVVEAELVATGVPGAAVAVVIGDRLVFAEGFGVADVETRAEVTPRTLFRIASTTKMLTAAAMVTLAERGTVDLHEPVRRYVPGLPPGLGQLTLHQLLSHTAGLRDASSFYGPHDDAALADFVSSWTDDYLVAEPGEIFSYSNLGLVLAGRVLEAALDRPYADAMKEVLFDPLGMERTTLRPGMAMTYPVAQGHEPSAGETGPTVVRPYSHDVRYAPAGGVFTSAADFARFAIAFLNDGVIDGEQVLPPSAIEKLATPHADVPSSDPAEHLAHGYGLNVRDHRGVRVVQHGGLRVGFGSLVRLIPEHRVAVLILTNSTNGLLLKSLETATELAVRLQPPSPAPEPTPVSMDPAEMREYAGIYENAPDYLRLELIVEDGRLFLAQEGQPGRTEVRKIGPERFAAGGTGFLLIHGRRNGVVFMHIAAHALRKLSN